MFCNKCGNELNEEDLFCPKCGNKVEFQSEETKSFEQQGSEEYKSKIKLANDAADLFLKEGQHNIFRYNQICAMYGELEQIGSHIPSTYIDELDFFVKANLLDNGVYFNTVESFEKTFDEILRLALSNIKTDEEKNTLKLKYIKPKILSEYEEKLQNKKNKQKKEMKPFTIIFLAIIIIPIFVSIMYYIKESKTSNIISDNNSTVENTIQINTSINEEIKENIKKMYSKVSGYGSSNIIKALYWNLADGTPALLIAYSNSSRNGMYITIDYKVSVDYGDEESLYSGSGRTKRESKEIQFTLYKDDKEHTYLTGDEFRSIINN